MKRVRLLSVSEKSLESRMLDHDARRKLVVAMTCASVGLIIAALSDVGAGAQTAIALASFWQERSD